MEEKECSKGVMKNFNKTGKELGAPPCNITKTPDFGCYCPADYYGSLCQERNDIECTIAFIDDPEQKKCPTNDSYYYYASIDGDQPCYYTNKKDLMKLM